MERIITPNGVARLEKRELLDLDPHGSIAIKRDVHEFIVEANADDFATAFATVLTHPESTFGLIRVKRPHNRLGKSFREGERFQGCFSIERAIRLRFRAEWLDVFLAARPTARVIGWLEDMMLSNYAEVREISEHDGVHRVHYVYLDGTPIAGSTTFTVEPLDEDRCRVRQVFEYQEQDSMALASFQRMGLKMHDQVVWEQIHQTARMLHAEVVSASIPTAYGAFGVER